MTKSETAKVIGILQSTYADTCKNDTDEQTRTKIMVWQAVFQDAPASAVIDAIIAYIAEDGGAFMPTPGQINNRLHAEELRDVFMSEGEAWSKIRKAFSVYDYDKTFAMLPGILQKTVGDARVLRDWALTDQDSLSVVESNVKRAYRTLVERFKSEERTAVLVPEKVRIRLSDGSKKELPSIKQLTESMKL